MEFVDAVVLRIFDTTSRTTKTGDDFRTRKVLIEFNSEKDYPDRIVLEQGGDKKLELVSHLQVGERYRFHLGYRANEWTDKEGRDTAFGSISAWRIEPLGDDNGYQSDLPF